MGNYIHFRDEQRSLGDAASCVPIENCDRMKKKEESEAKLVFTEDSSSCGMYRSTVTYMHNFLHFELKDVNNHSK